MFVRADRAVSYGDVMEVMNPLRDRRLPEDRPGRSRAGGPLMDTAADLADVFDRREWLRWNMCFLSR